MDKPKWPVSCFLGVEGAKKAGIFEERCKYVCFIQAGTICGER